MRDSILERRLQALFASFDAVYHGGVLGSNATKGAERESFTGLLLSDIFQQSVRVGTGDIIDNTGKRSGQVDLVLEYPRAFSFPAFPGGPRLYLAENVAAVVEVKSNLKAQKDQCRDTAQKVKELERYFERQRRLERAAELEREACAIQEAEPEQAEELRCRADYSRRLAKFFPPDPIPVLAVGYEGWATLDEIKSWMESMIGDPEDPDPSPVDAVFVVKRRIFFRLNTVEERQRTGDSCRGISGTKSLLWLLEYIQVLMAPPTCSPSISATYK
ncbi:MAG: DUF6602 domain-containing protein [Vulcanimicrobiota bacterium]